jgi:hypothetical protein
MILRRTLPTNPMCPTCPKLFALPSSYQSDRSPEIQERLNDEEGDNQNDEVFEVASTQETLQYQARNALIMLVSLLAID